MRLRLLWLVACGIALAGAGETRAQTWPTKPIRIVTPFPAGGQLDVVVRLLAEKMSPVLGQPIVVDNRTGADGNIGAEAVARSAPDGYTWLATTVPFATQISLNPSALRYHPVKDFQAVAKMGTSSFVLVVPVDIPVKSVKEFVAYAKANRGKLSYGGTSVGSVTHLSTEMFKRATGTEMEMIPYAGIPPALTDLVTGRTQFMSLGLVAALPQIKAGKLRPLAVLDDARHPLLPDVLTIVDEGYADLVVGTWFGLFVPVQTPKDIVARINAEVMKAMQSPEVLDKYKSIGVEPVKAHDADAFARQFDAEIVRWGKVVVDAKIKTE